MIKATWRKARTRRRCETRTRECRPIMPGDYYRSAVVSPDHDDLGNTGWLRVDECEGCATLYGRPRADVAQDTRKM